MGFFKSKKCKEIIYENTPGTKTKIKESVDEMSKIFKDTFKDANDMVFREFTIGSNNIKGFLMSNRWNIRQNVNR